VFNAVNCFKLCRYWTKKQYNINIIFYNVFFFSYISFISFRTHNILIRWYAFFKSIMLTETFFYMYRGFGHYGPFDFLVPCSIFFQFQVRRGVFGSVRLYVRLLFSCKQNMLFELLFCSWFLLINKGVYFLKCFLFTDLVILVTYFPTCVLDFYDLTCFY
jgi:hypothetical protein